MNTVLLGSQAGSSVLPHPLPPKSSPERALRIPQDLGDDPLKEIEQLVIDQFTTNKTQSYTSTELNKRKVTTLVSKKSNSSTTSQGPGCLVFVADAPPHPGCSRFRYFI